MMPLVFAASLSERTAYHEAGHATAALAFGIPIISVTVDNGTPHMHRGHYRAPHDRGLEVMVTLCLAGPAAEALFCGPITDGSDHVDIEMARSLSRLLVALTRSFAHCIACTGFFHSIISLTRCVFLS